MEKGAVQLCGQVCCACCSKSVTADAQLVNPDNVLGSADNEPDRNSTRLPISSVCTDMCLGSRDYTDNKRYRGSKARMAKEAGNLDVPGAAGRVYAGSRDKVTFSPQRIANMRAKFEAGEGLMTVEVLEEGLHDLLSADPRALEWIDMFMAYVEERLAVAS